MTLISTGLPTVGQDPDDRWEPGADLGRGIQPGAGGQRESQAARVPGKCTAIHNLTI